MGKANMTRDEMGLRRWDETGWDGRRCNNQASASIPYWVLQGLGVPGCLGSE
jgi:hypothetical protein